MSEHAIATRPPMDFAQMETAATVFAASGLFPIWNSKERVMTLMMLCQAEGIDPLSGVNRYDYINGRIAKKAVAIQSDFQRGGGKVEWLKCTNEIAIVKLTTRDGIVHEEEFTIEDASRAQLVKPNSGWTKYPKAMLRARCLTAGVRAVDPESLNLMISSEEAVDVPPERERNITPQVDESDTSLEDELTLTDAEVVEDEPVKESAKNAKESKTAKKEPKQKEPVKGKAETVEQKPVDKVAEEVTDPHANVKMFLANLDQDATNKFLASINWGSVDELTNENFVYINENRDNFAEKVASQILGE